MDYFNWWLFIAVCFHRFNCSYADDPSEKTYTKKAGADCCNPQQCPQKPKCEKSSMIPCLEDRAVLESLDGKNVLCDTKTDGGGWIILQRIINGEMNFTKNWAEYRDGFGSFDGDFWIGNEMISKLTAAGYTDLRIDMIFKGQKKYVSYKNFTMQGEADLYRMSYKNDSFGGSAKTDHFRFNNGNQFTTFDRGPSRGCIGYGHIGWWWPNGGGCGFTNLNGVRGNKDFLRGIYWYYFTGANDSLEFVEMKLRKPNP